MQSPPAGSMKIHLAISRARLGLKPVDAVARPRTPRRMASSRLARALSHTRSPSVSASFTRPTRRRGRALTTMASPSLTVVESFTRVSRDTRSRPAPRRPRRLRRRRPRSQGASTKSFARDALSGKGPRVFVVPGKSRLRGVLRDVREGAVRRVGRREGRRRRLFGTHRGRTPWT